MSVALVVSQVFKRGASQDIRAKRVWQSLRENPNKRCILAEGVLAPEETVPCHRFKHFDGSFESIGMIRRLFADVKVAYCMDFEAARILSLSGCRSTIILDAHQMPSLAYQDKVDELDRDLEQMATLIEREELTLRRCNVVICPNLNVRQFYLGRGVPEHAFVDLPTELPKPARDLSSQDLNHYVFEHGRERDAKVVYEALLRLQIPWRLSVFTDDLPAIRFWSKDSRVSIIKDSEEWHVTLKTARIAIAGGSRSREAECGFSVPRIALWAPHFGVSIVGAEHRGWRSCIGGWGLVLPDRPDLLSEKILELSEDDGVRLQQHAEIEANFHSRLEKSRGSQLQRLWARFNCL